MGKFDIIQNITFLGGAINFNGIEKEKKWYKIFQKTVSGKIRNIFSKKDQVLLGYSFTHKGKSAAGRNQIPFETFGKILTLIEPNLLNFKNLEITFLADSHDGPCDLKS